MQHVRGPGGPVWLHVTCGAVRAVGPGFAFAWLMVTILTGTQTGLDAAPTLSFAAPVKRAQLIVLRDFSVATEDLFVFTVRVTFAVWKGFQHFLIRMGTEALKPPHG